MVRQDTRIRDLLQDSDVVFAGAMRCRDDFGNTIGFMRESR